MAVSNNGQDIIKNERLKIYEDYAHQALTHPYISKGAICESFGFNEGTIDSIRKKYGLPSPYYFTNHKSGGRKLTNDEKTVRLRKTEQTKLDKQKLVELRESLHNPDLTTAQKQALLDTLKEQQPNIDESKIKKSRKIQKTIKFNENKPSGSLPYADRRQGADLNPESRFNRQMENTYSGIKHETAQEIADRLLPLNN